MFQSAAARRLVPTFSPLHRQSAAQQTADLLRADIVEGRLALGASLDEHSLGEALGIGRAPLREALQTLQNQGLVEIEPYLGARVFQLSRAQLRQLGDFRAVLEASALGLAMHSQRNALVTSLGRLVEPMQRCVDQRQAAAFSRLDTQWHEAVIARCGNEYLVRAYREVGSRLAVLRTLLRRDAAAIESSCADHHRLFDLVQADREDEAVSLLAQHVSNGTDFYTHSLAAAFSPWLSSIRINRQPT